MSPEHVPIGIIHLLNTLGSTWFLLVEALLLVIFNYIQKAPINSISTWCGKAERVFGHPLVKWKFHHSLLFSMEFRTIPSWFSCHCVSWFLWFKDGLLLPNSMQNKSELMVSSPLVFPNAPWNSRTTATVIWIFLHHI